MKDTLGPYAFPEVDGADALIGNRLYGMSGRVEIAVEGKRFRVAFLPAFRQRYEPCVRLVLAAGERRAALDIETLPLPELLGYPDGLAARDLPGEVLRAYLEGVLGVLIDRAGRLLGQPLSVIDAGLAEGDPDAPGADRIVHLELDASEAEAPEIVRARLHLAPEEYAALAQALPAPTREREEWRALPMALRFRVGSAALSLAECGALGRGDIVLLADDPLGKGAVRVCAGDKDKPLWTATWMDGTVSLEEECDVDMVSENEGSQGGAPGNLEALEVQITFDLGSRMATLAELKGLAPGAVMALPENPDARVGIRVGGKQIGSGSLIMLDGRAGVRVESLWNGEGP